MFEILILVLICWNAVDRPMLDSMSMIYALQRDGIMYYVVSVQSIISGRSH